MRYLCLCWLGIILFGTSIIAKAAPGTIDQLQQALWSEQRDTARMRIFLQLSDHLRGKNSLSIKYADSALIIAEAANDSGFMSKSYAAIARNQIFVGDFNAAYNDATHALELLPATLKGSPIEADILIVRGDANNRLSDYSKAISDYLKARNIVQVRRDTEMTARIDNNIGVAYWHSGNLDLALDAYQSAVKYFENKKDTSAMFLTYSNIAAIYEDLDRPDQQLKTLNKLFEIATSSKGTWTKSWAYKELGSYYLSHRDTVQAIYYYDMLPPLAEQMPMGQHAYETYTDLARFYNRLGDKSRSFQYYYKALTSQPENDPPKTAAVHSALAELYTADSLSDSVVYHAEKAFGIAFKSGDHQTLAVVSQMLAKHYQQEGNIQKAIDYAIMAFDNASGSNPVLARDVANLLGILYESTGKHAESDFYMKTYHALADSIRANEENRKTRIWSSALKYERREAELNSRIEYQQHRIKMYKILAVLLGCMMLMVIWIAVTSYRLARMRKRTNIRLSEQKNELEHTYQELARYQGHLQQLVDERTSELKAALLKAQESDRFKAALLSNMSHEIRTPLSAITGLLQFIDDPSITREARTEMIEQVQFNSVQLLNMIDDIVTLSKIDSDTLELYPSQVDINSLFEDLLAIAQKNAGYYKKNNLFISTQIQLPENRHTLYADKEQLKNILLHLVDNAIKFTSSGYVRLGCRTVESETYIDFFIEDSGVGISQEHIPYIFDRFWKKGDLYVQDYRGLGIGLPLCRELATLMGGKLNVGSTLGEGSVFDFILPFNDQ